VTRIMIAGYVIPNLERWSDQYLIDTIELRTVNRTAPEVAGRLSSAELVDTKLPSDPVSVRAIYYT